MRKLAGKLLWLVSLVSFVFLATASVALAGDGSINGEEVTDLAAWSTISGALLPFLIGMILQQSWSRSTQATVSAAICVIDAVVITYFDHGLSLDEHLVTSVALVFVTAQTTYRNLWKPAIGLGAGEGLSPFNRTAVR